MMAFYPQTFDAASVEIGTQRGLTVQHMAGAVRIRAVNGGRKTDLLLSAQAAYELAGLLVYAVQNRVIPRFA